MTEKKKVGPITPDEVRSKKAEVIPGFIFEAVNEMIAIHWDGSSARVLQKDVIKKIKEKKAGISSEKIFENHWLDFEEAYRHFGWKVSYDKPAYNENYDAFWEFRKRK